MITTPTTAAQRRRHVIIMRTSAAASLMSTPAAGPVFIVLQQANKYLFEHIPVMPPCPTPDVLVTDGVTNGMALVAVPLGIALSYWLGICCLWTGDNFVNTAVDIRRARYGARRLQVLATTCSTIISITLLGLAAIAMVRWTTDPEVTPECARRAQGVEWFTYMCLVDLTFGTTWEFVLLWALGIDVHVFQQPVVAITDEDMRRQREDFRHRKLPALLLIQVLLTMSLKGSSVLLAIILDQDPPGYGWTDKVSHWTVRGVVVGVTMLYAAVRVLALDISRGWRTVQLKTPGLYVQLEEFRQAEDLSLDVRNLDGSGAASPASGSPTASPRTPPPTTPEPRPTLTATA